MKVAIPKESYPGERRVALVPAHVPQLTKAGLSVSLEAGAGLAAGFSDEQYAAQGVELVGSRDALFAADVIVQVRSLGANPEQGRADLPHLREGQVVIGCCDPLGAASSAQEMATHGVCLFGLELIPRITRAQSMDVLSSMATIAGYRAVLLAAVHLPKIFPMLMTAAGTVAAARVFVIGAGVAGLQAIATARRLGAIVRAYDLRPDCREQVESLGAKFVELPLEAGDAQDQGGYAKAMDEAFYQRQRQLMAEVVAESDVVITTAAIPGRKSPVLITEEAVDGMAAGSVIVDLAAERGGNCVASQPDQEVERNGVLILGPTNLPAEIPQHASQMFSSNVTRFLLNMTKDGQIDLDADDQIVQETMMTRRGQVIHTRLRELLELPPLTPPEPEAAAADDASESPSSS